MRKDEVISADDNEVYVISYLKTFPEAMLPLTPLCVRVDFEQEMSMKHWSEGWRSTPEALPGRFAGSWGCPEGGVKTGKSILQIEKWDPSGSIHSIGSINAMGNAAVVDSGLTNGSRTIKREYGLIET